MKKEEYLYVSYRETKDGKFYLAGYYYGGISRQFYDIGIITEQGCEVLDTVSGFRQAKARLQEILQAQEVGA